MKYEEVIDAMYTNNNKRVNASIENIKKAVNLFDNPQNKLKVIHITGTNGKGSVAAMLFSILKKKYKVGLFTSPHLVDFRERIRIQSKCITKQEVVELYEEINKKKFNLTFFEFTTLMAFLYFSRNVDYAIIEVGMGGKWDATNVVNPILSIITRIGKDHTNYLGEETDKIVMEKVGIIKPKVPVITLSNNKGIDIIEQSARNNHSKLIKITPSGTEKTNMKGEFQKENAALAKAAIKTLNLASDKEVDEGLLNVKWYGRLQFLKENVLLDCAHNSLGAMVLSKFIDKQKYKNKIFVFGCLVDKNFKEMLDLLTDKFNEIILMQPLNLRARKSIEIYRYLEKKGINTKECKNFKELANKVELLGSNPEHLIVISGSIYLIGDYLKHIGEKII